MIISPITSILKFSLILGLGEEKIPRRMRKKLKGEEEHGGAQKGQSGIRWW